MYVTDTYDNKAKIALSTYFYSKNSRLAADNSMTLILYYSLTATESTTSYVVPNYLILHYKCSHEVPKNQCIR